MRIRRVVFVAMLVTFLAAFTAAPAGAATLVLPSQNINLVSSGTLSEVLNFAKFNPSLGTLTGMTITYEGTATSSGSYWVQQLTSPDAFGASWNVLLDLAISGAPMNSPQTPQVLSAFQGCAALANAGSDHCNGTDTSVHGVSSSLPVDNWQEGPGTFAMNLVLSSGNNLFSSENANFGPPPPTTSTFTTTGFDFQGKMTVTYTFDPANNQTPEPGTPVLLAAGIGVVAFLKRRG